MFKLQFRLIVLSVLLSLIVPLLTLADDYCLVTPLTGNKNEVESMLQVVRTEIPKAAVKTEIEKRVFHRVVAGRFDDMASAIRLRSYLIKKNITSFIIRSKNRYSVITSSFLSEERALLEQGRLASKLINTSIVKVEQSTRAWRIHSVDSYGLRDAVYTASIINTKDVITTIE